MMREAGYWPTRQLQVLNWGAFNHASYAPQFRSCNYNLIVALPVGQYRILNFDLWYKYMGNTWVATYMIISCISRVRHVITISVVLKFWTMVERWALFTPTEVKVNCCYHSTFVAQVSKVPLYLPYLAIRLSFQCLKWQLPSRNQL